jgi:hypothetical protein
LVLALGEDHVEAIVAEAFASTEFNPFYAAETVT